VFVCRIFSRDDETRGTVSAGHHSSPSVREWIDTNTADGLAALGEISL